MLEHRDQERRDESDNNKNIVIWEFLINFCSWQDDVLTLKNLNFDVSGDKVVMVVGPVGSGKVSVYNAWNKIGTSG